MTKDQKSKISIQHLFRVAGHPFALQMPLLSIPSLPRRLSLSTSRLSRRRFLSAGELPCRRLGRRTHSPLRPCKAADYLPLATQRRFSGHRARETNKTKGQKNTRAKRLACPPPPPGSSKCYERVILGRRLFKTQRGGKAPGAFLIRTCAPCGEGRA